VTFKIATRGLLGLKNALLTATRGTGLVNTIFDEYRRRAGDISMRDQGSLVAFETGQVGWVAMSRAAFTCPVGRDNGLHRTRGRFGACLCM
jgi:GTP-binding protein